MTTTVGSAALLAHEGGWDEVLLVGGPILVIVGLLVIVKRRVEAQVGADPDAPPDLSDPSDLPGTG